jgi:hypothetical protein
VRKLGQGEKSRFSAISASWHGSCSRDGQQGCSLLGVKLMHVSKFETFAFAIGFIATGFLTLVALPLAA